MKKIDIRIYEILYINIFFLLYCKFFPSISSRLYLLLDLIVHTCRGEYTYYMSKKFLSHIVRLVTGAPTEHMYNDLFRVR